MRAFGYALARAGGRRAGSNCYAAGANANRAGDNIIYCAPTSAPMPQGHEKTKKERGETPKRKRKNINLL
jgi:hypothetical protein